MSGLARERGTGNMNDVLIIGIAGGSGSGKTTLTNQIASQFQEHVTVLKHDNYYKAHDDMTYEERTSLNYDHPNAFDTELMIEHLKELKAGHRFSVRSMIIRFITGVRIRSRSFPARL